MLMIACFMPAAAFAASATNCAGGEACKHAAAITDGNGTTHYDTLAKAIEAVQDGQTIEVLEDITGDAVVYDKAGVSATLDLKNTTFKATSNGNSTNHRVILVKNGTLTVKNGTLDSRMATTAEQDYASTIGNDSDFYGTVRASGGKLILSSLTLYNNHNWGMSIKADAGAEIKVDDCVVNSVVGGGLEGAGGTIAVRNSSFTQKGDNTKYPFIASGLAVSYGGRVDVYNTGFETEGNYALYVYNSGGTINVYGGTFSGSKECIHLDTGNKIENVTRTNSIVKVYGGTFTGNIGTGGESVGYENIVNITGGTFSIDPSDYVVDSSISELNDDQYVVRACTAADGAVVAKVGDKYYKTLAGALNDAEASSTVTLLKDVEVKLSDTGEDFDDCDKSLWFDTENITLDLNGKTLTTISNNGGSYNILNIFGTGWTIKNGSIIAGKADETADSYAICVECESGTLTLDNVSLSGGVAAYDKVTVTLKNTTMGKTTVAATNYYCAYAEGGAKITVEGGEYTSNGKKPVFYAAEGQTGDNGYPASTIEIKGGKFTGSIFGTNEEAGEKGTISITGGFFNTKPESAYCADGYAVVASGNSKYPFTVAENKAEVKTADTAATEVKSEGAEIEVTKEAGEEATEEETKAAGEAVSRAAEAVASTTSEGLEVAAVTEAQKTVAEETASEAKETLKKALENVEGASEIGDATTVNIFVQPYLDITITDAKVETTTNSGREGTATTATVKELTLNIVPMVKTIASTANTAEEIVTEKDAKGAADKTQNAVEVGTAKEVKVTTPVTITIPLPSGFVTGTTNNLYIKHTKSNGTSYVYTATVTSDNEASPTYYATFTNPNGFSQFVITTEDASEAKIGNVGYTSLAAALAAAEDGDTVTLLKDGLSASMSGSSRTIKLVNGMTGEADAESINVTINGKTITLAKSGEVESFTYTKRSSGGGSSGAVTPPAGDETDDTAKTDEEIAAENAAKAAELASALKLTARSAKTEKGNIKVTLTVDSDAIRQIEGLGYTVKYKFYRSTKKAASYKAKYEKADLTYTNTTGTKGTRYYYKARVMVYDAQGALVAKTELKQCKYACRIK